MQKNQGVLTGFDIGLQKVRRRCACSTDIGGKSLWPFLLYLLVTNNVNVSFDSRTNKLLCARVLTTRVPRLACSPGLSYITPPALSTQNKKPRGTRAHGFHLILRNQKTPP